MTPGELDALWAAAFPGDLPLASEIRHVDADRWVRFHSLPGSKRYPETEDEYAEVLRRHRAVLAHLAGGEDEPVLVVTPDYGPGDLTPDVRADPAAGLRDTWFWRSAPRDDVTIDLYVSELTTGGLDGLLRLVADDVTADVLVLPDDLFWLYHPYDGGADVVLASVDLRDRLAGRFAAWLAPEYVSGFRRQPE